MGTEAVWIPLALTALGAGGTAYNNRQVANRQDEELSRQLSRDSALQRQADDKVRDLLKRTSESDPKEETAQSLKQYTDSLRRNVGSANGGVQQLSGASDEYQAGAAEAGAGISQFGDKVAGLMSRVDGPIRQREGEGLDRQLFQNVISLLNREGQGQETLSRMRMDGIRPNPIIGALSEVALGAAGSMGGGGGKNAGLKKAKYKGYRK